MSKNLIELIWIEFLEIYFAEISKMEAQLQEQQSRDKEIKAVRQYKIDFYNNICLFNFLSRFF